MGKFLSKSPNTTKKAGELLGRELKELAWCGPHAFFIALSGELGSGKTVFTKGIARGLGIKGIVHSPTFLLMKRYPLARSLFFKNLWHVDCYRISKPKELYIMDFKQIAQDPGNIIVIEWPESMQKDIPEKALRVFFEHESPTKRKIYFKT